MLHQLYKNISPKQILQEHKFLIQERQSKNKDHVPVRDDFLNKHDVLNISKRLAEDTFQHDVSEAEGVKTWIHRHPELVLFHQEENAVTNSNFILAIQTPWQEEKMITLGHQNVVACDATYGRDKLEVSPTTAFRRAQLPQTDNCRLRFSLPGKLGVLIRDICIVLWSAVFVLHLAGV